MHRRHWQNWLWIAPLLVLVLVLPHPHVAGWDPVDTAVDAAGFLLLFLSIVIRVFARGWKYEAPGRGLVTDGLYGLIRHPLYAGSFLIGLGLCLIFGQPWFTLAYVVCFTLGHLYVIRGEEEYLGRKFPEVHARYRWEVPALIPKPGGIARAGRLRPRRLGEAVLREADAVCLWPLAGVLLMLWESAPGREALLHPEGRNAVLMAIAAAIFLLWLVMKATWLQRRKLLQAQEQGV
jgi:protein-S-isoprenylcysteine O-methyltransferase Ste14